MTIALALALAPMAVSLFAAIPLLLAYAAVLSPALRRAAPAAEDGAEEDTPEGGPEA